MKRSQQLIRISLLVSILVVLNSCGSPYLTEELRGTPKERLAQLPPANLVQYVDGLPVFGRTAWSPVYIRPGKHVVYYRSTDTFNKKEVFVSEYTCLPTPPGGGLTLCRTHTVEEKRHLLRKCVLVFQAGHKYTNDELFEMLKTTTYRATPYSKVNLRCRPAKEDIYPWQHQDLSLIHW